MVVIGSLLCSVFVFVFSVDITVSLPFSLEFVGRETRQQYIRNESYESTCQDEERQPPRTMRRRETKTHGNQRGGNGGGALVIPLDVP